MPYRKKKGEYNISYIHLNDLQIYGNLVLFCFIRQGILSIPCNANGCEAW